LELAEKELSCPHCQSLIYVRWGKQNDLQRYKCRSCSRTFNVLSKTPLARLRRKGHWIDYSECMKNGLSIRESARICNISNSTSFHWRHRFLKGATYVKAAQLNGIVESDETYFLKSNKGDRNLSRPSRKRGGTAQKRGLSKEQICVLVCRDRNKNTFDAIFETFNSQTLKDDLLPILASDCLFCSDSKNVYTKFTRENDLKHGKVNLSKGERVKKNIIHTQNVNSYHSRLKNWIRRFNGVATKYLDNYLAWFRELDEFSMEINPKTILLRAKIRIISEDQLFIRT